MSVESIVEAGRRLIATTLLDTCTVLRLTLTPDGAGGQEETWTAVASAVACRFSSMVDPDPTLAVDAVYGAPTGTLLLALGADIRKGDHVLNPTSGKTYLAVGNKTADSVLAVAERVLIREL